MPTSPPTQDEIDDVLLACRYGDLPDIDQFIRTHGKEQLASIKDEAGNTVLHMTCANGHQDVLSLLLPLVPVELISTANNAQNTPLHWAAVNSHLHIAQQLVEFPGGPGVDLIDIKNANGRTPLGEAEHAGWEDGAVWMCKVMNLSTATEGEAEDEEATVDPDQKIQVEIEDADGGVARMTI